MPMDGIQQAEFIADLNNANYFLEEYKKHRGMARPDNHIHRSILRLINKYRASDNRPLIDEQVTTLEECVEEIVRYKRRVKQDINRFVPVKESTIKKEKKTNGPTVTVEEKSWEKQVIKKQAFLKPKPIDPLPMQRLSSWEDDDTSKQLARPLTRLPSVKDKIQEWNEKSERRNSWDDEEPANSKNARKIKKAKTYEKTSPKKVHFNLREPMIAMKDKPVPALQYLTDQSKHSGQLNLPQALRQEEKRTIQKLVKERKMRKSSTNSNLVPKIVPKMQKSSLFKESKYETVVVAVEHEKKGEKVTEQHLHQALNQLRKHVVTDDDNEEQKISEEEDEQNDNNGQSIRVVHAPLGGAGLSVADNAKHEKPKVNKPFVPGNLSVSPQEIQSQRHNLKQHQKVDNNIKPASSVTDTNSLLNNISTKFGDTISALTKKKEQEKSPEKDDEEDGDWEV